MRVDLDDFSGGLNTYKDDDQLSLKEAQTAQNCFVGDGALVSTPNLKSGTPSESTRTASTTTITAGSSSTTGRSTAAVI